MLDKLKDIQEPLPPSFWPLAWGWWLLIAIVLLLAAVAIGWLLKTKQNNRVKVRLQQRLQQLGNGDDFLAALNQLLKEAAIYYYDPATVGTLSGKAWVSFLQQHSPKAPDRHTLELLEAGPYAKSFAVSFEHFEALKQFAQAWIAAQGGKGA
ncbi:DUF4381 domain-containing protein [Gallaecimonas mangrovi]|uniref:DUF4381 domain-containing protein n=1 Tax=Gallaecimonas mangrovi TaxID=2291597 RepID=UPI000E2033FC|nr:DUF4381 domain-containing protein [Gallaecimonas mangrovi]